MNELLSTSKTTEGCPVCGTASIPKLYRHMVRDGFIRQYDYYICKKCDSIFIQPDIIKMLDNGGTLIQYTETYWEMEVNSAIDRCYGPALARMAEAVYYARIPIRHFLDIGTGTGHFLDAVEKYLPSKRMLFYGVEKYPPEIEKRTKNKNYFVGGYDKPGVKFNAGICIEVLEHLTPNMLKGMLNDVAKVSNEGALYVFNSGLSEYTKHEDENYIDPFIRGHIISYSIISLSC